MQNAPWLELLLVGSDAEETAGGGGSVGNHLLPRGSKSRLHLTLASASEVVVCLSQGVP